MGDFPSILICEGYVVIVMQYHNEGIKAPLYLRERDEENLGRIAHVINVLQFCSDGAPVRLQIWDTAGQERFRCLIPSYLRDCHAILVCFDVTNCRSLDGVMDWIELAQTERLGRVQKTFIVLVGNKVDEKSKRQVSATTKNTV